MALVLESDGDAVVVEAPQAFAQRVVQFTLPFAGQEGHDLVAAHNMYVAVSPVRVDGVCLRDAVGVASVPRVLGGLYLLDRRLKSERR